MDSNDLSLINILAEASASGMRDSEGSFTIAESQALAKLASFQLPRKPAWILKIIQAAIALEASTINIKQGAKKTQIVFLTLHLIDLQALKGALINPVHQEPGYLGHFATGLRAVGFGSQRNFQLSTQHDGLKESLTLCKQGLALTSNPTKQSPPSSDVTVELSVDFPIEEQGRSSFGIRLSTGTARDEYLEVTTYAQICPCPLTFDGRRLDLYGPQHPGQLPLKTGSHDLGLGCYAPLLENPGTEFNLPEAIVQAIADQESPQATGMKANPAYDPSRGILVTEGHFPDSRCSSFIKVSYNYAADYDVIKPRLDYSYLHWLIDGVITQSQKLNTKAHAISVHLYISGHNLPTDLSGLTFHDHAKPVQKQQLQRILPLIPPLVGKVGAALRDLKAKQEARTKQPISSKTKTGLVVVGAALVTSGVLWGWPAVLGLAFLGGQVSAVALVVNHWGKPATPKQEDDTVAQIVALVEQLEELTQSWQVDTLLAPISSSAPGASSHQERGSPTGDSDSLAAGILSPKPKP